MNSALFEGFKVQKFCDGGPLMETSFQISKLLGLSLGFRLFAFRSLGFGNFARVPLF